MKAFFVGDNRTSVNWGRAASIALRELLSQEFEITGCVAGEFFDLSLAEAGIVKTLTPAKWYGIIRRSWRERYRKPFSWVIRAEQFFGAKDFIDADPKVSVDNLIANKDKYWSFAKIYEQASAADVVVVDGDGDIIFTTPPRRQTLSLLAYIELGFRLGKPVFLVNSMISDCPTTGRNASTLATAKGLFERCRGVFLRDEQSFEYVKTEMPGVAALLVPDSLFLWCSRFSTGDLHLPSDGDWILPYPEEEQWWGKLDFSQPYICIGGGALAGSDPSRAVRAYGKLVEAMQQIGYRIYLTENDLPDSFLRRVAIENGVGLIPVNSPIAACAAVLANARVFISGRYHPSILASLGGTPCIFLGSHAHKMDSLAQLLGFGDEARFAGFPSDADIDAIVSLAKTYLEQGDDLRGRILQAAQTRCAEVQKLPSLLRQAMTA